MPTPFECHVCSQKSRPYPGTQAVVRVPWFKPFLRTPGRIGTPTLTSPLGGGFEYTSTMRSGVPTNLLITSFLFSRYSNRRVRMRTPSSPRFNPRSALRSSHIDSGRTLWKSWWKMNPISIRANAVDTLNDFHRVGLNSVLSKGWLIGKWWFLDPKWVLRDSHEAPAVDVQRMKRIF